MGAERGPARENVWRRVRSWSAAILSSNERWPRWSDPRGRREIARYSLATPYTRGHDSTLDPSHVLPTFHPLSFVSVFLTRPFSLSLSLFVFARLSISLFSNHLSRNPFSFHRSPRVFPLFHVGSPSVLAALLSLFPAFSLVNTIVRSYVSTVARSDNYWPRVKITDDPRWARAGWREEMEGIARFLTCFINFLTASAGGSFRTLEIFWPTRNREGIASCPSIRETFVETYI